MSSLSFIKDEAKEYLAAAAADSDSLDEQGKDTNKEYQKNKTDDKDGYWNTAYCENVTYPNPENPEEPGTLEPKEDTAQTPVQKPEIGTTMTDDKGNKSVVASDKTVLIDTIAYKALDPSKWYRFTGTLMVKDTKDPLVENGNSDCIYWLKISGTEIDYPVMYHPQEEEYYLYRDFDKEYSPAGSLYLAENCDPVHGDNLIIYGHHMRNGAMFAHLEDYKDEDFYKKHKRIELETLQGHEDYEIIAAFTTPVYTDHDYEYYKFTTTEDPAEFNDYVRQCKEKSIYETGKTAQYGQRLLTLSTCEYSQKNGRMVVVAVRTREAGSKELVTDSKNAAQEVSTDGGDR